MTVSIPRRISRYRIQTRKLLEELEVVVDVARGVAYEVAEDPLSIDAELSRSLAVATNGLLGGIAAVLRVHRLALRIQLQEAQEKAALEIGAEAK